ncbi:transposase [Candidatus Chlorohelix sp.]|uniref:transposase n=1 Tax=Candidatus Chlorohelix sp. TaxID=3139201 RepID=UPI00301F686B
MSEWLVYFTNLSGEKASLEEVVVLYRLRWQIELLFKLWKQAGGLEKWRSGKPYRILCEVYAKLIGVIVSHWLSLLSGWEEGERSLVKASQVVRQYGLSMVLLLPQTSNLVDLFEVIRAVIRDTCRVNKRRKYPSAYQCCLDPSLVAS